MTTFMPRENRKYSVLVYVIMFNFNQWYRVLPHDFTWKVVFFLICELFDFSYAYYNECSFILLTRTSVPVRLFVKSFVHTFNHSYVHMFVRSFVHLFIRSFVRSSMLIHVCFHLLAFGGDIINTLLVHSATIRLHRVQVLNKIKRLWKQKCALFLLDYVHLSNSSVFFYYHLRQDHFLPNLNAYATKRQYNLF